MNFFASWCPPCKVEHPQLQKLSNDKDLLVLGINKKDQPDVIGITHTTLYTSYVVETIKEIRENISKDIPIVLGGYHPTLRPRESINLPGVNAVICGEGEYILSNYMDALESKSELYNIPGLLFKLDNGSYFENPRAGWIEDISSLPFPDYELWEDVDKYLYFIHVIKRGKLA